MRRCVSCGATFEGQRWQKICWPCWRKKRDSEEAREAYLVGFRDGQASTWQPPLDPELLRRAVALTHSDRHPPERFAEANAVTAALLNLRERGAA